MDNASEESQEEEGHQPFKVHITHKCEEQTCKFPQMDQNWCFKNYKWVISTNFYNVTWSAIVSKTMTA